MKSIKYIVACCVALALLSSNSFAQEFVYDDKGYPDQKTVENLFDEMDYQRAVQAYLWAVAPMAIAGQHKICIKMVVLRECSLQTPLLNTI